MSTDDAVFVSPEVKIFLVEANCIWKEGVCSADEYDESLGARRYQNPCLEIRYWSIDECSDEKMAPYLPPSKEVYKLWDDIGKELSGSDKDSNCRKGISFVDQILCYFKSDRRNEKRVGANVGKSWAYRYEKSQDARSLQTWKNTCSLLIHILRNCKSKKLGDDLFVPPDRKIPFFCKISDTRKTICFSGVLYTDESNVIVSSGITSILVPRKKSNHVVTKNTAQDTEWFRACLDDILSIYRGSHRQRRAAEQGDLGYHGN